MHRDSFGQLRPNLRTVGEEGESGSTEATAAQTTEVAATEAATETTAVADATQTTEVPDWAKDPAQALREVEKARREAADARTKARDAAKDEARQDLLKQLGLKDDDAPADPKQVAADLAAAKQASKDAALQLAIYRAAPKHQGNPDALLDSRAFLASVQSLDPTSSDFSTQVSDAIKTAVTSNTSLRLVQATGSSAADHAGGSGEHGAITEQQLASMTPEQTAKAFAEGRLNHLL